MNKPREFWNSTQNFSKAFSVFEAGAIGPIRSYLDGFSGRELVCDLGCGVGDFLPYLSKKFREVWAVDFADRLLHHARELYFSPNTKFLCLDMEQLGCKSGLVDIVVSIGSLISSTIGGSERMLAETHRILKNRGVFVGMVPSIDTAIHLALLKIDELRQKGMSESEACRIVMEEFQLHQFDAVRGLISDNPGRVPAKYFHPFEIRYRFEKAGFSDVRMEKLYYPWEYCRDHFYGYFPGHEEIWDWFVTAKKP